jgi:hypothetical protein
VSLDIDYSAKIDFCLNLLNNTMLPYFYLNSSWEKSPKYNMRWLRALPQPHSLPIKGSQGYSSQEKEKRAYRAFYETAKPLLL